MNSRGGNSKGKILHVIDREKKSIIDFCSKVIQIPSENPPGRTTELVSFLRDYLESNGLRVEIHEPQKDMPNLVATIGSDKTPNLVLNAHMDVYPAETGGGEEWTVPPFSGTLVDGKIFGRGASDMKGGLTALVQTFVLLANIEKELRGRLTLTLVSDEESGGRWGTQWLLDNVPAVLGDACLSGEPTAPRAVGIGEKGILWLRLKGYGKSYQGAYTTLGDNAIVKITKAVSLANRLNVHHTKVPSELTRIIRGQKVYWEKQYGRGTGRLLDHITVNAARIAGGRSIGLVPAFCEVELNTRAPVGTSTDYIERALRKMFQKARLRDVEVEVLNKSQPNYTSPNERIVKLMANNIGTIIKDIPMLAISIGASDQRMFRAKGIPSVRYGPTPHGMGSTDEYILVKELLNCVKIHSATAADYLTPATN